MRCISLFSGSSGNALFVAEKNTRILVDAGVSFRRLARALNCLGEEIGALDCVFFTHEHSDHIGALPMLLKKTRLPLYLAAASAEAAYGQLAAKDAALAEEFIRRVRTVAPGEEYEFGEIVCAPFSLPHDSAACLGAVFGNEREEKLLGIATDLGEMTREARQALCGCRAVVLESNHDPDMLENGPYPPHLQARIQSRFGHLSNPDSAAALEFLCKSGCERALLFHLSRENNTAELALSAANEALRAAGSSPEQFFLAVATPDSPVELL